MNGNPILKNSTGRISDNETVKVCGHKIFLLDLFSGIGGFTLAANKHGFETIGFSETDRFASRVLAKRFPDIHNFGSVCDLNRNQFLERTGILPDVIAGGFPCQPHSVAGLQKAEEDDRDLWGSCARILGEFRPRFALFENVGGLLSSSEGLFFNRIMSDLAQIRYGCICQIVPASAVGAPHERDRVWILCADEMADPISIRTQIQIAGRNTSEQVPRGAGQNRQTASGSSWGAEPSVGRVANGVSNRMDRLKSLGNAIVPQVAEIFFQSIQEYYERFI